jgi:hypothetical protein
MITLRWILGVATVAAAVFFVFLKFQLQGLFGGRKTGPAEIVLPLLAFALWLAGILFPHQRILLHLGAGAAAIMLIICIAPLNPVTAWGIPGLLLWLFYYWLAAWRGSPGPWAH